MDDFVAQLGGSPGGPSERQMNQESLMKALLGDKNMQEKTRSWRVPGAEPGVFTCFFLLMFPKPNVLHAFRENSAARAAIHWAAARPNRARTTAKTQGFGNMLIKKIVKTQGSASEQGQNPVFFNVFMSLDGLPYK